MKVFVTGDIHGNIDFQKLQPRFFPHGPSLSEEDALLIAGDFGLPLLPRFADADHRLDDLASRKYTTLFVDGNHEHFDYLASLQAEYRFEGPVGALRPNVLHLRRGNVYELGGFTFFAMGGARGVGNMAGYGFDSRETPSEGEWERAFESLEERDWTVDFVVTHAAPARFLPLVYPEGFNPCPVSKRLDGIFDRLRFVKWFCGHYHKDIDFLDEGLHLVSERILAIDSANPPGRNESLKNCRAGLEEGRDWKVFGGALQAGARLS